MRHAYLDEAGISKSNNERHYIVAAAITNPDRHWHDIVNYYDDLARNWLSQDEFDPAINGHFVFHAMDVWHGSGLFPRNRFSLQQRLRIFRQLAQAPDLLAIPICFGIIDKETLPKTGFSEDPIKSKQIQHSLAYGVAIQGVDLWMERHCRGEVCMITAEDTDTVKRALQVVHFQTQTTGKGYAHENTRVFKTRSIVDAINFAEKRLSPIMQMADHCAFILRRVLSRCPHIGEFADLMKPSVFQEHMNNPRSFTVFHNR